MRLLRFLPVALLACARARRRRLRRRRRRAFPSSAVARRRQRHDHEGAVQLPARRREAHVQGAQDRVPEARDDAVQGASGPGDAVPRAAVGARAEGEGPGRHGHATRTSTARLKQIKKQYFGGSEAKYQQQLKAQGLTEPQLKLDLHAQILSEKLYNEVTEDVKVTDADIAKYYNDATSRRTRSAASRDVRHILVNSKKLADTIESQLKSGGDFGALAKKYSKDPGSAATGRQADDLEGPDGPAVRQGRVLAQDERDSRRRCTRSTAGTSSRRSPPSSPRRRRRSPPSRRRSRQQLAADEEDRRDERSGSTT